MNSPILSLVPVDALPVNAPRDVPLGASWFRTDAGGVFGGRSFGAGDLLVCVPRAGVGDQVVLIPSGRGRPRLGSVSREGLKGDAGEPCDPSRWSIAGRVVRVVPGACAVEPSAARSVRSFAFRGRALESAQLALFGA